MKWDFDRGAGVLELEPEFETNLLRLTVVHRKINDSRMTLGTGVKLDRREAYDIGNALIDWAKRQGDRDD